MRFLREPGALVVPNRSFELFDGANAAALKAMQTGYCGLSLEDRARDPDALNPEKHHLLSETLSSPCAHNHHKWRQWFEEMASGDVQALALMKDNSKMIDMIESAEEFQSETFTDYFRTFIHDEPVDARTTNPLLHPDRPILPKCSIRVCTDSPTPEAQADAVMGVETPSPLYSIPHAQLSPTKAMPPDSRLSPHRDTANANGMSRLRASVNSTHTPARLGIFPARPRFGQGKVDYASLLQEQNEVQSLVDDKEVQYHGMLRRFFEVQEQQ